MTENTIAEITHVSCLKAARDTLRGGTKLEPEQLTEAVAAWLDTVGDMLECEPSRPMPAKGPAIYAAHVINEWAAGLPDSPGCIDDA